MVKRGPARSIPVIAIVLLVLSACGQAAVPTATPAAGVAVPLATATPAAQMAAPTPSAAGYVLTDAEIKKIPYTLEKVRELVADNYYLAGMFVGKGEEPRYGGVATITHRMDIPSADPMVTSTISLTGLTNQITSIGNLVRPKFSDSFETELHLAQSYETADDFKTWTFKLRPDIKWHDGVPVTAEDIKFWINLGVFPPAGRKVSSQAASFGNLKEVQVIDGLTVRLILKEPTPFLFETLMGYTNVVSHPRHLAQPQLDKGNLKVNMSDIGWVGLGPFKFDKYDAGSRFRVVRFESYFEKDDQGRSLPYLDAIDFPIIPDPQTGVSAFRAGRVDGTARGSGYHLNPAMVGTIKKDLKAKAWFLRTYYAGAGPVLNATKPPFDDIRLRKAIQLFIDRQEWANYSYGGFAQVHGLMRPGTPWWNPDVTSWPGFNPATKKQDQETALRILKEAGLTGTSFGQVCRDNYLYNCESADSQFQKMGLKSFIDIADTNREVERSQSGQYQAIMAQIGGTGSSFPGKILLSWVTTNPLAAYKTGDTKLDELHKEMSTTMDPVLRRDLTFAAERYILLEKAYAIPGPWEEGVVAYRAHIRGLWIPRDSPLQNNEFNTLWIDPTRR